MNVFVPPATRQRLLFALLAYGAASLLHHVHNAAFLYEYPNMPSWITPAAVYAAWGGEFAIGALGYVLLNRGHRIAGLALLGLLAAFGLGGLAHYGLAPFLAHSPAMNATILIEAATAALLLAAVALHVRPARS